MTEFRFKTSGEFAKKSLLLVIKDFLIEKGVNPDECEIVDLGDEIVVKRRVK